MASYMNEVTCSTLTDYKKEAGCLEPYDGGIDRKGLICEFTSEEIATIAMGASPKVVTDIIMKTGKKMFVFEMKEDSGLAGIESTLNDNDSREKTDNFTFQGQFQEGKHFDWFEELESPSRYWLLVLPLAGENDNSTDRYMVFGHDGGLRNISWSWTSGKRGEFTGFEAAFQNKTRDIGRLLVADATKYPLGNSELIDALQVEAA